MINYYKIMSCVTLHVSVWVEIKGFTVVSNPEMSRSTWACELKLKNSVTQAEPIGHAPRERVSWNADFLWNADETKLSRSTWACELKYYYANLGFIDLWVTLHVSVWVEMKILTLHLTLQQSRSTWACELKCLLNRLQNIHSSSRSTWACELKLM